MDLCFACFSSHLDSVVTARPPQCPEMGHRMARARNAYNPMQGKKQRWSCQWVPLTPLTPLMPLMSTELPIELSLSSAPSLPVVFP